MVAKNIKEHFYYIYKDLHIVFFCLKIKKVSGMIVIDNVSLFMMLNQVK